ncbi:MAG: sulfatase-like hydrolase/transferase [Akkermansiaceae bacterium]
MNRPSISNCIIKRPATLLLTFLPWIFSLALTAAFDLPAKAGNERRPNILFILTEDQGAQMSLLGTPGLSTPNMDRLARSGVYFNQAFVNYPVCSPSKANIYTGTYCHTNGLRGVTTNWHGREDTIPDGIANHPLTKRLRIRENLPTLVELLQESGYTCAITSKLHVQPVSKFPYDHFLKGNPTFEVVRDHFANAGTNRAPVFFFANISPPHRPFRDSDKIDIGIDMDATEPPPFLPDTPACRKDWAEYLAHCEQADRIVGEVMRGLDESGQKENTIILFMGDHGPAYHRGKLALYDFGIRVPLAISGPGIHPGAFTDQMVSGIDLMPTLLELCGLKDKTPALQHGRSIAPMLRGETDTTGNDYIFSEIHHGAMSRDDGKGMQERCAYDGRWKLIYRENCTEPRQVNADLKYFRHPENNSYQGNRVYDEIVKRRKEFPDAFRYLAQIDNGALMPDKPLPRLELYDLREDPWELNDLSAVPAHKSEARRLFGELRKWAVETNDVYTGLKSLPAEADKLPMDIGLQAPAVHQAHTTDNWVATDALGRSLPGHSEVGDRRPEKHVGIFYFVWVGNDTGKVYDISKILVERDESKRRWGPEREYHFGCEPEYGYFHASDPWVIRRDMQMLANAGVDFLYIDVTNALIYEETVDQLLKVIQQMRKEGIPVPQVTFVTNAASGRIINRIYDRFYKNPKHRGIWFEWEGKPLIFGVADDPILRKEVGEHFTIKRSWAWTDAKKKPDHWQWLDTWPQDFGWSESPDVPDQIPVATASHASNSIGKSYQYRTKGSPPVGPDYLTEKTGHGLFFEEQWQRAHEVNPKVVMISGWNEWIAMRFIKQDQESAYAGRPAMKDGTWFVDVLTPEFSRDIAPMRGGYTDNYYYQMISHIRRFKGLSPAPERAEPQEIRIDGNFKDWDGVPANFLDPGGDTMHRSFRGTDPDTTYSDAFGRNDIVSTRVVEGRDHVNFMVSTAGNLTPHTDANWMILLIDRDQDKGTGWEGYDLAVNWAPGSATESNCARWTDGKWRMEGKVAIGYEGKNLEIGVPNKLFPRNPAEGFDFKWVDNVSLKSVESLFIEGDAAPDRRFNYRY